VVKFIKYLPALGWLPVVLTIDDQREYVDYRKQGSEACFRIFIEVSIYRTTAGEPSLEYLQKEKELCQRNWLTKVVGSGWSAALGLQNLAVPDQRITWPPFALAGTTNREKED
jgi:hypothetical protein